MDLRDKQVTTNDGFEIWGYPGAGKSTQAHLLSERTYITMQEVPSLARCFVIHPKRVLAAWSRIPKSAAHLDLRTLAIRQSATLFEAPKTIVGEGLAHEIWRLLFRRPELLQSDSWRQFIPYAGPNIIILDLAPREALSRILSKPGPGPINRQLAGCALGDPVWRRAIGAYEAVQSSILNTASLSVRRIKVGNLSADEVSSEIAQIMSEPR
jgi:hypothetical protein